VLARDLCWFKTDAAKGLPVQSIPGAGRNPSISNIATELAHAGFEQVDGVRTNMAIGFSDAPNVH
jgi:hypothetical protein